MDSDKKYMNCSLGFMIDLDNILNKLMENKTTQAQIGNIVIVPLGVKEDTISGKRQVFEVVRYIKE